MNEGATVGQYRILRKIGEGGMGAVYLAEHALIGRRAAIKVLLPQLSMQREIVDRFFNEARATTAVPDPGIVQVFDFGVHTDGSAFIVMEFLEGESLDARMRRLGRVPVADALRITRQAAGSLAAAHERGIVHRDLKPENIFLVRDAEAQGGERPKILDFGIAKLGGNDPTGMRTRTGAMMGTPVYMSPEQCRGAGLVDHRSDVYSLACVLFHMITGRPPFEGEGVGEIIAAHLREPARPPSAVVPGLSPDVDALVLRCLEKQPDARISSMAELAAACGALMARISASGAATVAMPASLTPLAPGFRSEYPGAPVAPVPGTLPPPPGAQPAPSPTTLGAATGAATKPPAPPRRRTGLWVALALLVSGGLGAALALGAAGGDGGGAPQRPTSDTGQARSTSETVAAPVTLPDAAPSTTSETVVAPVTLPDAASDSASGADPAVTNGRDGTPPGETAAAADVPGAGADAPRAERRTKTRRDKPARKPARDSKQQQTDVGDLYDTR